MAAWRRQHDIYIVQVQVHGEVREILPYTAGYSIGAIEHPDFELRDWVGQGDGVEG